MGIKFSRMAIVQASIITNSYPFYFKIKILIMRQLNLVYSHCVLSAILAGLKSVTFLNTFMKCWVEIEWELVGTSIR